MSLLHLVRWKEHVVWVHAVRQREFLHVTFTSISHVLLANQSNHLARRHHHLHDQILRFSCHVLVLDAAST